MSGIRLNLFLQLQQPNLHQPLRHYRNMKHKILLMALLIGLTSVLVAANGALYFNQNTPNNDYVTLGTGVYNSALVGVSGVTVEVWIRPASIPSGTTRNRLFTIPIQVAPLEARVGVFLGITGGGAIEFGGRSTASDAWQQLLTTTPNTVSVGTWSHVAGVINFATGNTYIFLNGTQVATRSVTYAFTTYQGSTAGPEVIGGSPFTLGGDSFVGTMDEMRIWDYAKTATEINALKDYTIPGPYPGLVGNWSFDETANFTASDTSGNSRDGTLVNFNNHPAFWVTGKDNLITLPIELSSFTATPTNQYFIQLHWVTQSETDVMGYYIHRSSDNQLANAMVVSPMIQATNSSAQTSYDYVDQDVTPGTWYYWLQSINLDGSESFHGPIVCTLSATMGDEIPGIPISTKITEVYPNPFNPNVTINYSLLTPEIVGFKIYNSRGQMVYQHDIGIKDSGNYRFQWNGVNNDGNTCPAGVYLIKMTAGNKVSQAKAVLSK